VRLYSNWASSASFRVRIGLHLKRLEYEYVPVRLKMEGGDQEGALFSELNPQQKVPLLLDDGVRVAQSLAILEYLDETRPDRPLLPDDAADRARVRSLALWIGCEIQPLNNLRVERHLTSALALAPEAMREWRRHWIAVGFDALEAELGRSRETGQFCHGNAPTLADCFLVPQVANSQRPNVALDLARWPTVERIYRACLELPEVTAALPASQPDAPPPA
jgi:maleylacetoacetate isomerase